MAATNHNSPTSRRRPDGRPGRIVAPAALMALMALATAGAQTPQIGPGFAWSADVVNSDFRSDTLDLAGNVRVAQGVMSIEAQAATAQGVRSDSSRWTFTDAVHIRTAAADLQSNSASAAIVDGEISHARVEGSPARFEQRGGQAESQIQGRAGVIDYDFGNGIVTLTNQVWFSNGKDEFRGDVVIYDVREERVQINPAGSASGRVRGIIRPRERTEAETQPDAATGEPQASLRSSPDSVTGGIAQLAGMADGSQP